MLYQLSHVRTSCPPRRAARRQEGHCPACDQNCSRSVASPPIRPGDQRQPAYRRSSPPAARRLPRANRGRLTGRRETTARSRPEVGICRTARRWQAVSHANSDRQRRPAHRRRCRGCRPRPGHGRARPRRAGQDAGKQGRGDRRHPRHPCRLRRQHGLRRTRRHQGRRAGPGDAAARDRDVARGRDRRAAERRDGARDPAAPGQDAGGGLLGRAAGPARPADRDAEPRPAARDPRQGLRRRLR